MPHLYAAHSIRSSVERRSYAAPPPVTFAKFRLYWAGVWPPESRAVRNASSSAAVGTFAFCCTFCERFSPLRVTHAAACASVKGAEPGARQVVWGRDTGQSDEGGLD